MDAWAATKEPFLQGYLQINGDQWSWEGKKVRLIYEYFIFQNSRFKFVCKFTLKKVRLESQVSDIKPLILKHDENFFLKTLRFENLTFPIIYIRKLLQSHGYPI